MPGADVLERVVKFADMYNKEAAITGNRIELPHLGHLGVALLSGPGCGEVCCGWCSTLSSSYLCLAEDVALGSWGGT